MLNKRAYNILFHTHTVSGIVISVALYVIFFAGSFSFFRDEIVNWERGQHPIAQEVIGINVDTLLAELAKKYRLEGRTIDLHQYYNERQISVDLSASLDTNLNEVAAQAAFFYLDVKDFSTASYEDAYTLGEFLYRLHFFAQIPYPLGYYLSGLVAFFFLFALLTGILIHWDKIVKNFYVFRPWAKLKTIWTDAHTALGLIGFPFQLVYALTGAFFMLKAVLIGPFMLTLYGGDQDRFYEDLEFQVPVREYTGQALATSFSVSSFIEETQWEWPDFQINEIVLRNYGDANMEISLAGNLPYAERLNGQGKVVYSVADGKVLYRNTPQQATYLDGVKNLLYRLHLADYGGLGLRLISFAMGLVSCFVILSGMMIWLVARQKTGTARQQALNRGLVKLFMAICLSLYPVTALAFIGVKLFAPIGQFGIYQVFFLSWLLATIGLYFTPNYKALLSWSLWIGLGLGLLVPLSNALSSDYPIWLSYTMGMIDVFVVDLLWIVLSLTTAIGLWAWQKKTPNVKAAPASGKRMQP